MKSANQSSIRTTKVQFCLLKMAKHPAGIVLVTSTSDFLVKDRVASCDVKIEYCPTEDMMVDFFTKPLQGALFLKMRNQIMNANPLIDYRSEDCRSVLNLKCLETRWKRTIQWERTKEQRNSQLMMCGRPWSLNGKERLNV
jgi:hypothetical protein